ncbi:MAG: hypothetical protein ACKVYV_10540 [Limisphaerales bacterium]
MKPVRLTKHALSCCASRGFAAEDVEAAIRTASWGEAELDRLECRKDFPFGRNWNGKPYATRQVRPVFVEEAEEIVEITVYTYYF